MLHYINKGTTIEIEMPAKYKDYSVTATFVPKKDETDKYLLSLSVFNNTVRDTLPIKEQEVDTQIITSPFKMVKVTICKMVEQLCQGDFFDKYVNLYEYYIRCFEIGNEILEKERLSKCQD